MKLSKYNIIKKDKHKDEIIIYNLITSGVLKLNNDEHKKNFEKLLDNLPYDDKELDDNLKYGKILIEDDVVEEEVLELLNKISRFDNKSLTLTIAPTLRCNFACPYCYEKGIEYTTMSEDTQNAIINFISNYKDTIKHLSIAWYGGEPLIAIDIIESLSKKIFELIGSEITYSAYIVTNGYFLTRQVALKLKDLKVQNIQITIDGNRETHNGRRRLLNGDGTFDKIIKNINDCWDVVPITLRTNVDKSNVNYLDELLQEYKSMGFNKKVGIYIAPVDDINASCRNTQCFSMEDFSDVEISFLNKLLDNKFYNVTLPSLSTNCGAVSLNSFVIDPQGDIYKCWNNIGNEQEKVGNLFSGMTMNKNLTSWLLYDSLKNEECKQCGILPICMGGCAYHKIKTGEHKCSSKRYNIDTVLDLFNRSQDLKEDVH